MVRHVRRIVLPTHEDDAVRPREELRALGHTRSPASAPRVCAVDARKDRRRTQRRVARGADEHGVPGHVQNRRHGRDVQNGRELGSPRSSREDNVRAGDGLRRPGVISSWRSGNFERLRRGGG